VTIAPENRHVLIVGIDGVRYDSLVAAHTPNLDALARTGFIAPVRVDDRNPTISGPVWSTVATGVYRDRHGVHDNDLRGHRFSAHPDFLSRVRAAMPSATTFAAAAWGPLVTAAAGGPVFAPGGYRPGLPAGAEDGDLATIAAMDEAVASRAARALLHENPAAAFVYLVLVDMVGHAEGVTDRYRDAIETCDQQLGVLLAAIAARPTRDAEEWTVVVVTDHGHRDAGHHGGDSDAERTAWMVAAGPRIDASVAARGVDHADIHPHVLDVFGIRPDPEWALEGEPLRAP
jgi:Uncharacterized proteins of the AP superfamily